jgi:hypothetical protein
MYYSDTRTPSLTFFDRWHHLLKGNFMQGKHNQHLNHLLHILVDQAMPYLIHHHCQQEFGFEGPDLKVKKHLDIKSCLRSITLLHISQASPEEGNQIFFVQSQSTVGVCYWVGLDTYNCESMSFPVIYFCKHICAVQNHFPEECKPVPRSMLAIHCADSLAADPRETDSDSNGDDESNEDERILPSPMTMINKLSKLAIRLQARPPTALPDYLQDFYKHLNCVVDDSSTLINQSSCGKKKVAPNQHSCTETAAMMNVRVKSKRKAHTDPYAGGEQPGKKAKPDA